MSATHPLVQATAAAPLAPRRTAGEALAAFIRTKPVGAGGALIILAMLLVALFA